jgi:superfamily II DNA/RNA helicase
MAAARPLSTVSIVKALPRRSRIILFCERIEAAERLYDIFLEQFPDQVGLYHSKMADITRQDILERYKHGVLRLLICCKALDEGLNIPSTDAGIIVSSSMSARQRVQRLGRMLRRSKEIKRVYYLYMGESSEDSELVHGLRTLEYNIPIISLHYISGAFIHSEYERLRINVLEYVSEHRYDPEMLEALNKNIDKVLLRGDFLLSESACRENLQASHTLSERNYWTSALYMIYARLGKLCG